MLGDAEIDVMFKALSNFNKESFFEVWNSYFYNDGNLEFIDLDSYLHILFFVKKFHGKEEQTENYNNYAMSLLTYLRNKNGTKKEILQLYVKDEHFLPQMSNSLSIFNEVTFIDNIKKKILQKIRPSNQVEVDLDFVKKTIKHYNKLGSLLKNAIDQFHGIQNLIKIEFNDQRKDMARSIFEKISSVSIILLTNLYNFNNEKLIFTSNVKNQLEILIKTTNTSRGYLMERDKFDDIIDFLNNISIVPVDRSFTDPNILLDNVDIIKKFNEEYFLLIFDGTEKLFKNTILNFKKLLLRVKNSDETNMFDMKLSCIFESNLVKSYNIVNVKKELKEEIKNYLIDGKNLSQKSVETSNLPIFGDNEILKLMEDIKKTREETIEKCFNEKSCLDFIMSNFNKHIEQIHKFDTYMLQCEIVCLYNKIESELLKSKKLIMEEELLQNNIPRHLANDFHIKEIKIIRLICKEFSNKSNAIIKEEIRETINFCLHQLVSK
uniref:Vezatin domain-containing protein n=1 Tax=Parastrongyloides trichosuri TaxID=131310 RepID=A0A0N4ZYY3_PARTI